MSFEVNWNPDLVAQAQAETPWWRRVLAAVTGPVADPVDSHEHAMDALEPRLVEIQPAEVAGNPALDRLVDRVMYATHGWGYGRGDVALLIHEALWQIGHLVRQGATLEVPELGTFRRSGARVEFQPDPDLLGCNDA